MVNHTILTLVMYVYGIAGICYIISSIFKNKVGVVLATWITIIGVFINTVGIIMRWVDSFRLGLGRFPLYNLYEFIIFFSLTTVLIFLLVEMKYRTRFMGALIMPLAFFAMAYATLSPHIDVKIIPIIPLLKNKWLIAHILTYLIAYAVFTVSFCINCMYFFSARKKGSSDNFFHSFQSSDFWDELAHRVSVFGFFFLLAGLITGSVFANIAWGRYWGWDPKETWSLITSVFYLNTLLVFYFVRKNAVRSKKLIMILAILLLLFFNPIGLIIVSVPFLIIFLIMDKLLRIDRRTISAVLLIISFAALLFTFVGVSFLPGLHSYV